MNTRSAADAPVSSTLSQGILGTRGWVLDVDGCLMRTKRAGGSGGEAMPRAAELVRDLRAAGHAVVVCTNASQKTPADYATHLRAKGIEIPDHDVVTAGSAAADYIAVHHPGARVLVVGDVGLTVPLRDLGVDLADPSDPQPADVVVVGAADAYTTPLINAACLAVDAGAPLYSTVASPWFHGGIGKSVAVSAAIAAAVAWTTGTDATALGKPSPALGETLLRRLGAPAQEVTVVGDATAEINLARTMGAHCVLVLSGATSPETLAELTGPARPDAVTADIAGLYDLLPSPLTTPDTARDPSAQGDRS